MTVSADPPATLRDAPLPLASLLPLRAAVITLRFTEPSSLHFFHPPALTAFLRTLLGSPADYDIHLTPDALESGRTVYRAGDDYRFTLFCLASGEALMQTALERLMALPGSTPSDPFMPFRDNLVFRAAHDLFLGHAVKSAEELSSYTLESLEQEAALWSQAQGVFVRWLSPVRLLRPKETRQGLKGEARYCHTRHEVSGELLFNRLHDALADLLRRRGQTPPPHSWLAKLASRTPQLLTADGQLRPVEPSAPAVALAPAADLPLRLGESEEQGTVLFVTGRSVLLSTSEGRLQVEREEQTILSLPWSGLHAVALIGPHHLTTPALKAALKHEVPIHFASHTGGYQGVTWSGQPGMEGYQIWLEQQRCFSDPVRCLGAARSLIEVRLRHQREVLRQRAVGDTLAECFAAFDRLIGKTRQAASRDELNGFEGQATRLL